MGRGWWGLWNISIHMKTPLQWRHNERDGAANYRRPGCLLNRLFMCRSQKTSKFTGLCEGNPSVAGGFPSQRASNMENVSIWWRYDAHSPVHSIALSVMSRLTKWLHDSKALLKSTDPPMHQAPTVQCIIISLGHDYDYTITRII